MPTGVYVRTKAARLNISKSRIGSKASNIAKRNMSKAQEKRFAKMSEEERLKYVEAAAKAIKEKFSVMTKEEKLQATKKWQKAGAKAIKEKFAIMTSKGRREYCRHWFEAAAKVTKDNFAKMTKEEKIERFKNWQMAGAIAAQKANPSSIEKKIWKELDKLGIKHKTQVPICGGIFIVDIYISSKKLIIECNGTFWHNYKIFPKKKIRDETVNRWAIKNGYKIIWLWEFDINRNPKQALKNGFKRIGGLNFEEKLV